MLLLLLQRKRENSKIDKRNEMKKNSTSTSTQPFSFLSLHTLSRSFFYRQTFKLSYTNAFLKKRDPKREREKGEDCSLLSLSLLSSTGNDCFFFSRLFSSSASEGIFLLFFPFLCSKRKRGGKKAATGTEKHTNRKGKQKAKAQRPKSRDSKTSTPTFLSPPRAKNLKPPTAPLFLHSSLSFLTPFFFRTLFFFSSLHQTTKLSLSLSLSPAQQKHTHAEAPHTKEALSFF